MMSAVGADPGKFGEAAETRRQEGAGVVLVAFDGSAAGLLAVADPVRPSAVEAVSALRAQGLRVIMLTGDSPDNG